MRLNQQKSLKDEKEFDSNAPPFFCLKDKLQAIQVMTASHFAARLMDE